MKSKSLTIWSIGSIFCFALFVLLGLLNLWFVNSWAGSAYLLLSLAYIPNFENFIKKQSSIVIPRGFKYLLASLVLWGTIAIGDLRILFEAWLA